MLTHRTQAASRRPSRRPHGDSPDTEAVFVHLVGLDDGPERDQVNKERARSGESKSASKSSTGDSKSASQRGGERSHRGAQGPTKDQLYEEAKKKHVEGRSTMNKEELRKALGH
ncbi:plasmid stabilization protein [Streptomyces sp. NPDC005373]|uniref:plasmid stabilization protein n=1 Tax=unclassified Streptomyces TaxID=2593676 RepID=UPI0033B6D3FE